jgi:hydrogenase maturation protein HypF
MPVRRRIQVCGVVQGVGFRPHVYRLAHQFGLTGFAKNTVFGVTIEVQGGADAVSGFLGELQSKAPPLATIVSVTAQEVPAKLETRFVIADSESGPQANTLIAPDTATCPDCMRELLDARDRRFGYPFINCTNCGPRFTILRAIPYDRPNTSMAQFPLCPACRAEYEDPMDRRFHAQPNACWECGPQLALLNAAGQRVAGDPIEETVARLLDGAIVAIKGLGGFHLAVDATQSGAVLRLRQRKHRYEKPMAVMVANAEAAAQLCEVTEQERELLESPQRPIVLLKTRTGTNIAREAAPGNLELGVFLPYTPVQHLLFHYGKFAALVMTSANLSEEPICMEDAEAMQRLQGIADHLLGHNRPILLRCDDSLVRSLHGRTSVLRRSRGFVPVPILLDREMPAVLAVGAEMKNTVCLTRGRQAFLGQHIGDLENLAAYNFFQESIQHLQQVLEVRPTALAHDLHPDYLSTRWAFEQEGLPRIGVQHHHAHAASCMAENHLAGPVIGIVLDGTGYGTDGHIWGGEILVADYGGFRRAAHLAYAPMPGGAQAVRGPWRMAVGYLSQLCAQEYDAGVERLHGIPPRQIAFLRRMVERDLRSPLTSSCGRLFDAVAALIGLRNTVSYEAQAAVELEAACSMSAETGAYPMEIRPGDVLEIFPAPMFSAVLRDLRKGVSQSVISRRFHNGLVRALTEAVVQVSSTVGSLPVCLTGGCFQNAYLAARLEDALTGLGLNVFVHSQVPAGDGGTSLGQAMIAGHTMRSAAR